MYICVKLSHFAVQKRLAHIKNQPYFKNFGHFKKINNLPFATSTTSYIYETLMDQNFKSMSCYSSSSLRNWESCIYITEHSKFNFPSHVFWAQALRFSFLNSSNHGNVSRCFVLNQHHASSNNDINSNNEDNNNIKDKDVGVYLQERNV